MNVNKVYFNGRPDGLGNRLEELIKLQIYCTNFDKKIIYRWNNSGSFKYPVIFDCKDITIVEEKNEFNGNTFEKTTLWREFVSKNREYLHPQLIKLKNEYTFTIDKYDLGVHIRAKDRILEKTNETKYFDGFSTADHLNDLLKKSAEYVNLNFKSKKVLIVSDDDNFKKMFISKIHPDVDIVKEDIDQDIDKAVFDFVSLSNCDEILMASHYSTFAITASLMSNANLYAFQDEFDNDLFRFNTKFISLTNKRLDFVNMSKAFEPKDFEKYFNVGGIFNENFMLDYKSYQLSNSLVSFSSSDFFTFEEHLKLIKNKPLTYYNYNLKFRNLIFNLIKTIFLPYEKMINFKKNKVYLRRYLNLFSFKNFIEKIFFRKEFLLRKALRTNESILLRIDTNLFRNKLFYKTITQFYEKIQCIVLQVEDFESEKDKILDLLNTKSHDISYFSQNNLPSNHQNVYIVISKNMNSKEKKSLKVPISSEVQRSWKNDRIEINFI